VSSRLVLSDSGNFKVRYAQEAALFPNDVGRLALGAFFLIWFLGVPALAGPYLLTVANFTGIAVIGATGLNLLTGYTGQITLGQGAFMGVGAYTAAILASRAHLPFWLVVPLAGIVTAGVGAFFGIPSLRLKGLYLAIATLAAQFVLQYVFIHWDWLTRGTSGYPVPAARIGSVRVAGEHAFFWIISACAVLLTWLGLNLTRTRIARAFVAIRDNDRAAAAIGIHLFAYKLLAFFLSAFMAGVGGALYAYYIGVVVPDKFTLDLSIDFLAMGIVGGLGTPLGPLYGAVVITVLPEALRALSQALVGILPNITTALIALREVVFGGVIILFLLFEPEGLADRWRVVRAYFKSWPYAY
jgi:branched-chain amino acid transport system permease protein